VAHNFEVVPGDSECWLQPPPFPWPFSFC
jgi:hypothetical protein